jgi:hypothetical protein
MEMHRLKIVLPYEKRFDQFDPDSLSENLTDFRVFITGKENPLGNY